MGCRWKGLDNKSLETWVAAAEQIKLKSSMPLYHKLQLGKALVNNDKGVLKSYHMVTLISH